MARFLHLPSFSHLDNACHVLKIGYKKQLAISVVTTIFVMYILKMCPLLSSSSSAAAAAYSNSFLQSNNMDTLKISRKREQTVSGNYFQNVADQRKKEKGKSCYMYQKERYDLT